MAYEISLLEAHQILYKGQSNIAVMAKKLGIPLSQLQLSFRKFCVENSVEPDGWKSDVDLSWPYVC